MTTGMTMNRDEEIRNLEHLLSEQTCPLCGEAVEVKLGSMTNRYRQIDRFTLHGPRSNRCAMSGIPIDRRPGARGVVR